MRRKSYISAFIKKLKYHIQVYIQIHINIDSKMLAVKRQDTVARSRVVEIHTTLHIVQITRRHVVSLSVQDVTAFHQTHIVGIVGLVTPFNLTPLVSYYWDKWHMSNSIHATGSS